MKINWSSSKQFKGLILPSKWDKQGNPTELLFAQEDERNIPILKTKKSLELMKLVGSYVVVTGKVVKHRLAVKEYEVLNFKQDNTNESNGRTA